MTESYEAAYNWNWDVTISPLVHCADYSRSTVPYGQKTEPTSKLLCPRELDRVNCSASRPSSVDVTERLNAEASS